MALQYVIEKIILCFFQLDKSQKIRVFFHNPTSALEVRTTNRYTTYIAFILDFVPCLSYVPKGNAPCLTCTQ